MGILPRSFKLDLGVCDLGVTRRLHQAKQRGRKNENRKASTLGLGQDGLGRPTPESGLCSTHLHPTVGLRHCLAFFSFFSILEGPQAPLFHMHPGKGEKARPVTNRFPKNPSEKSKTSTARRPRRQGGKVTQKKFVARLID